MKLLRFKNLSDRHIRLIHKDKEYFIFAHGIAEIPENLYELIEKNQIPLEPDYEYYAWN